MRVSKRLLLITGALSLAMTAAACGGQESVSGEDSSTTASSPASSPAASEPSGDPVQIEAWYWGSPAAEVMQAITDDFNQQGPVQVKLVQQPFDSYFTLLGSRVAAQSGPDVVLNYASPALFGFMDGLTPLTDFVTPEQREALTGWANVSTGLSDEGTPYAVPWLGQGITMYYNKALLRQAGLDPEAPPETWDEFLAACAALKAAGIVPVNAGWKDGYYMEWWGDLVIPQLQTPEELAASLANPDWTSEPVVQGLTTIINDLVKEGYTTPDAEAIPLFPDAIDAFGAGQGAFMIGLAANSTNWKVFSETLGEDLGAMLFPELPDSQFGGQRMNYGPALAWSVTDWSEQKEAAYQFISYLTSADVQARLSAEAGSFPNNKSSVVTIDNPAGAQIRQWSTENPYIGQFTTIRTQTEAVFVKLVPPMVTGDISVSDAMEQVQAQQAKETPVP